MSAIFINTASPVQGLSRVYENLHAVGAPKRPADGTNANRPCVQLVQFFLRDFYRTHPQLRNKLQGPPGPILIDGKAGPQTVSGIFVFQQHARSLQVESSKVVTDARVSVPVGGGVPGTAFKWTIHALNLFFAANAGNAATFANLSNDPVIRALAPELQFELLLAEQLARS